jgi:hypothetical protein
VRQDVLLVDVHVCDCNAHALASAMQPNCVVVATTSQLIKEVLLLLLFLIN